MGLHEDGEARKISPGDLQLGQASGSICSVNDAWFHALNKCITDSPLSESILPLMRSCFFGGAMHVVSLLHEGHGDIAAARSAWVLSRRD